MLETALFVGSAFGVRHAFEADHLAAVATLVENEDRPASTGAAWGIGHSIPILVVGAVFLGLDLRIPPAVAVGFEIVVAIVLVVLGVRVITGREALGASLLGHGHDNGAEQPAVSHSHLTVRGRRVGFAHSHADEESFAVGVIHGLAGSGGVVVALAVAAPTTSGAASFLLGFSLATVCSMTLVSWGWGRILGRTETLRTVAGIASVLVGVLLFVDVTGVALLP